jgi:hypothetical protein
MAPIDVAAVDLADLIVTEPDSRHDAGANQLTTS